MLTLIRHGQASFGTADYDKLSQNGCAQARATGHFLRTQNQRYDLLCVGPRERHRATAQFLTDTWGQSPVQHVDPALDEFSSNNTLVDGSTQQPQAQLQTLLFDRIGAWAAGERVLADGLTLRAFRDRVGRWARTQLQCDDTLAAERHTLAVTSAGVITAIVCELMGLPDSAFLPLVCQVRNASFTELTRWRDQPALVSFNVTAHLPTALITHL